MNWTIRPSSAFHRIQIGCCGSSARKVWSSAVTTTQYHNFSAPITSPSSGPISKCSSNLAEKRKQLLVFSYNLLVGFILTSTDRYTRICFGTYYILLTNILHSWKNEMEVDWLCSKLCFSWSDSRRYSMWWWWELGDVSYGFHAFATDSTTCSRVRVSRKFKSPHRNTTS